MGYYRRVWAVIFVYIHISQLKNPVLQSRNSLFTKVINPYLHRVSIQCHSVIPYAEENIQPFWTRLLKNMSKHTHNSLCKCVCSVLEERCEMSKTLLNMSPNTTETTICSPNFIH